MSSTKFANDVLQTHNKYRKRHQAPNLKISAELSKFAQEWAENLASSEKFEHRPENSYGENIYTAGSTDPDWELEGETAVQSWYDETKFYKFGESSPENSSEVGHFTQLVWKTTTELGIGVAKSKAGKVYVVCNYDPPGNVLGEFGKNVIPLDNTAQNEDDDLRSMEQTEEAEPGRIVLTASQETMGIRIVQPNIKIVESMNRLYAVPSEKIRVWSVWLSKIEEEANGWHSWLISHINLLLRMSEYLRKAEELVERENKLRKNEMMIDGPDPWTGMRMRSHDELHRDDDEEQVEKTSVAADAGQVAEGLSRGTRKVIILEPEQFLERKSKIIDESETKLGEASIAIETKEITESEEIVRDEVEERSSDSEPTVRTSSTPRLSSNVKNNGRTNDENRDSTEESKNFEDETEAETEGPKKIAWPIGVPWIPVTTTTTTTVEKIVVPEIKNDDVESPTKGLNAVRSITKFFTGRSFRTIRLEGSSILTFHFVRNKVHSNMNIIPIPSNVEDMMKLVRDVNHQATIYESFYKHWSEVADRAIKEIMNRTVMPSDRVPTDEQVPYFFYLYVEPDIDVGIDNDDETILLPDSNRESITCEFASLYFNLADKPGKGGKPWL